MSVEVCPVRLSLRLSTRRIPPFWHENGISRHPKREGRSEPRHASSQRQRVYTRMFAACMLKDTLWFEVAADCLARRDPSRPLALVSGV